MSNLAFVSFASQVPVLYMIIYVCSSPIFRHFVLQGTSETNCKQAKVCELSAAPRQQMHLISTNNVTKQISTHTLPYCLEHAGHLHLQHKRSCGVFTYCSFNPTRCAVPGHSQLVCDRTSRKQNVTELVWNSCMLCWSIRNYTGPTAVDNQPSSAGDAGICEPVLTLSMR